jgi:hypothetical protein
MQKFEISRHPDILELIESVLDMPGRSRITAITQLRQPRKQGGTSDIKKRKPRLTT